MEHAPIIDRETIDMLREMDAITEDDLLLELIDDFLAHAVGVMAAIRASAQLPDYHKLAAHAHSLKGASLNIGVLGLFTVCDQIETLTRSLLAERTLEAGKTEKISTLQESQHTETLQAITKCVAELEPIYQITTDALSNLRARTSRGEAIDDLLSS